MGAWLADRKNLTIVALSLLVIALAALVVHDHNLGWLGFGPRAEPVAIVETTLEREQWRTLTIVFDRPLGEGHVGEVLGRDPATITPPLGGVWKWQGANVLQFETTDRFAMATEYRVDLILERMLKPTQALKDKATFTVRTEEFKIEKIDLSEEPAPDADKKLQVIIRGSARFNYPVNPEVLIGKMRLLDPLLGTDKAVTLEMETGYTGQVMGFRSQPIEKQKQARQLTLTVLSDLKPEGGNLPLAADWVQPIPLGSSEHLEVRGVSPIAGEAESTVRIRLSSPVNPEIASTYVSVTPAVKYRLSVEGTELILTGGLQPGSTYALQLTKGLPALDDAVLPQAYKAEVAMPDLEPAVTFQSQGMFLSASGSRTVALKSVNLAEAQLTIDRVYRNNLFYLFDQQGYPYGEENYSDSTLSHGLGDRLVTQTITLGGERNQSRITPLALDSYYREDKPGLYRVNVTRAENSTGTSRWLLLTDLGIVAKQGKDEFLVWVSSFATLAPIADAEVRLINSQNQLMATGRTNAEGLWRINGLAQILEKQQPYMIVVEKEADFSFLLFNLAEIDTAGFEVGGAELSKDGYTAYLYGERDIYRPGETVKGVAVVRDRSLQAPPAMPLLLRHRDPEGNERGTTKLDMTERGSAAFTLPVPAYARTGHHSLELLVGEEVIGQYGFQVEEFIPDRIKVEIAPTQEFAGIGKDLAYDVVSAYLFGPPAAGLTVESRVRLVPATFAPKGYDEFTFHTSERKFDDQEILSTEGTLDANGKLRFTTSVPAGLQVPSSLTAVITTRVREQGGRGVAALQRLPVHPYPYYVGLRRVGEGYPEPRQPVTLEYVGVKPDGTEATASTLRVDFFRDRWHTVLRRTDAGNYRYESTREAVLLDSQALTATAARGQFTFTPAEFGEYRVVLTDTVTGAAAQLEFFVSGSGYSPWAIKSPGRLELSLDKNEYQPGETAALQVRAPFSGKLLVTVEREGIFHVQTYDLTGNTATLSIPIAVEYRPNAYVTATLIRAAKDLEPGTAGRAFGAVALNVDQTSNRVKVEIAAPEEIRPLTTLSVQIAATPDASVTVAAVDEGILQLIAQKTPDPFAHFYQKLALGVRAFDIFSLLLPEVKIDGKSTAGGGEGEGDLSQFVRTEGMRRVEPVAFWSGVVTTDAEGKATVTFNVPEFQGALRLMAVAHHGKQFGAATHTIRVRTPLVVLPTFPRFLSFQETVQIPVTVRNDTGKEDTFAVALAAEGPVTIETSTSQSPVIAHKAEKTVYFTIKTGDVPADARFTLTAEGNGEKSIATGSLSLRADLPARTVEQVGNATQEKTTVAMDDGDAFRPETLRRAVHISPLPLVQFSDKLRYLLHYPYGCIEQTTSAAFPLVYFSDLAKELDPELFAKNDPTVFVQEGIRRVATMQMHDGGFAMWPDQDTVAPWGSVYATHFLVEARRAGHHVENFLYDRALEFVAREGKASADPNTDELQRVVYALYVAARAGKADVGSMDFVREHHTAKLKAESRALLGAAYAATGNTQVLAEITKGVEDAEQITRQTGRNLNSTIRNRALLLLAFLDAAPTDPRVPKLVQRLARDAQSDRRWTTQESAVVFVALGQFFKQQAQKKPYSGKLLVGEQIIGTFTNKTVTFAGIQGTGAMTLQMDAGYESGAAFYAIHSRGVPTDAKFRPEQAGLEIHRTFMTRTGGTLDMENIPQGELIVLKTQVKSLAGAVENVVIQNLLPAGMEVENPRLKSTETLPWVTDANLEPAHLDLRDDRVLLFTDLPDNEWRTTYTLLRAVTPGTFRLPPVQAEAMYDPAIRTTGERGSVTVKVRQ
ncbi:MAG: alpha-2-macroglobulin family protein [Deltaproteobacteria bacterium]|nr:alpha-2-macroglobulin family protein [Deltaproteobacteria bacterium]